MTLDGSLTATPQIPPDTIMADVLDNPPEHWEIAILGTGLAESILAAALAKAGRSVLHLDENDYYGSDSASLTLSEVVDWAKQRQGAIGDPSSDYLKCQRQQYSSISYSFRSVDAEKSLHQESRQYSISLLPSIAPSTGPLIDSLIGSGVSRYGGFRLLEGVGFYSERERKFKKVPSSKEDIFTDKDMTLLEKRQLMKFLMYAASDFEGTDTLSGYEEKPYTQFLTEKFNLSTSVTSAIAFAISHCATEKDVTLLALIRTRRYLRSAGRYGASPFLVGHYGGAGEISQGFCRAAAVQGATYILGRTILSKDRSDGVLESSLPTQPIGTRFSYHLKGFANPITSDLLVASTGYVPAGTSASLSKDFIVRCIAIIDEPVQLGLEAPDGGGLSAAGDKDDDGKQGPGSHLDPLLLVFPPKSPESIDSSFHIHPVFVLITGDATMSSPRGKAVVYLSTTFERDSMDSTSSAETILAPYVKILVNSGMFGHPEGLPLFQLFYLQSTSEKHHEIKEESSTFAIYNPAARSETSLTEVGDEAAREAERVFWAILNKAGAAAGEERLESLWPPLEEDKGPDGEDEDPW